MSNKLRSCSKAYGLMAHAHWRVLAPDYKINEVGLCLGLGFVLKCFARGNYAVEQEVELDKNIDYRCH